MCLEIRVLKCFLEMRLLIRWCGYELLWAICLIIDNSLLKLVADMGIENKRWSIE